MDGEELDRVADECFWSDDVDRSMELRRAAYRAHIAAGDDDAAAMAAWRLFYDHFLVDEHAVANGWRERGGRHITDSESVMAGWMALADADLAPTPAAARGHAERALAIALATTEPDLQAMALCAAGRAALADGDRLVGLGQLDEAMVAVINDELAPLFTGWVYCNVIGTCYAIADLRRATEWCDAALRWCATIREGHLYPGLCRVYRAEVADLRGDWDDAVEEAERACADLERFDERYAADAHYLRGELARRRGHLAEAAVAFRRSRELGGDPLPGQALLDATEGRTADAVASLRSAIDNGRAMPLPRTVRLRALVEVALQIDDRDTATTAAEAVLAIARDEDSPLLDAHALAAMASVADRAERASALRAAIEAFDTVGVPFEVAHLRLSLADVLDAAGDPSGAAHERRLADGVLGDLGVTTPDSAAVSTLLTTREREVIGLVAQGHTNREIADRLHLSHHTVNRHVSNVMAKLGVNSRAAASARVVAEGLV